MLSTVLGIGVGGTVFIFFIIRFLTTTLRNEIFGDVEEVEVVQTKKRVVIL